MNYIQLRTGLIIRYDSSCKVDREGRRFVYRTAEFLINNGWVRVQNFSSTIDDVLAQWEDAV